MRKGGQQRGGTIAAAMLVLVCLTACSTGEPTISSPAASSAPVVSVPVKPTDQTVAQFADGVQLTVPVGAVTGPATARSEQVLAPGPSPDGMTLGTTHHVQLDVPFAKPVALLVPLGASPGPGDVIALVYWDPASSAWIPVEAAYDASRNAMTATVDHLSFWSTLRVETDKLKGWASDALKGFFGIPNTAQPTCPGADQATSALKVSSSSGDIVKWCVGVDNGASIVRVASNRGYPLELDYPTGWQVRRVSHDPVVETLERVVTEKLSPTRNGIAAAIVGQGQVLDLVVPAGATGTVTATPSSEGYLIGAIVYGARTLELTMAKLPFLPDGEASKTANAVSAILDAKDCFEGFDNLVHHEVRDATSAGQVFRDAAGLATGCLSSGWKVAYGLTGATASFFVGVITWLTDGIKTVIDGLRGAIESVIYWQGYNITVATAPDPVLGIAGWGGEYAEGFGTVRPPRVFLGGDPTGLVHDIHWTSWGGDQAEGDGKAVNEAHSVDGTVAGAPDEPVHIVAWDIGTCGGKRAYRKLDWYFAGETPSSDLSETYNFCSRTG